MTLSIKKKIYDFAIHLQKFPRSLTGKGNLQTLSLIKKILKKIKILKIPSGYNAFDWKVPEEWDFKAYIKNKKGIKILDVKKLYIVNYSNPIKKELV